jgi:hypothetical protein
MLFLAISYLCPTIERFIFVSYDKKNVEKAIKEMFRGFKIDDIYMTRWWNYFNENITFFTIKSQNSDISKISQKNMYWIAEIIELGDPVEELIE